ncbi:srk1 [[Candida] subhashii]|uniref:Srk1 n=1 Tax=[Candida] subhashii TaxID=561895 RepID=A0A8J5UMK4_9ASCO|nr:srk1 [[Candida] subhashii]KAG7663152.1 srk1 [[Candida] subhashii]
MFENLKAFIRHGKQANELKKKQQQKQQQYQLEIQNSDSSQTPTTYTNTNDNNNPYQTNYTHQGGATDDTFGTSATLNDAIMSYEGDQPKQQEQQNYSVVATQLVEEERLERQQTSRNFPDLDRYEILGQMGEGAFSVVYKAREISTEKEVAIKVLRKFQMDEKQKHAVLKEVTIMRQLNHPNIVKFIEFIDSSVYYYIVQELAPGGEIFTAVVKYTYFSEDLARWVIVQVAHAIKYLHEQVGIVHRDIKPENLLFFPIDHYPSSNPRAKLRKSDDPNTKKDEGEFLPGVGGGGIGIVKLADFGLSKQIWEHNTKTPCGTVGYTAPEIVRDERYSREVDMWAIGCVLYTLLCGFPPFYDERIETLTEKVARGEYTFLQPWWDEISYDAKKCVSKLLTVDPRKRYTISEFLQDPWIKKGSNKYPTVPSPINESIPAAAAATVNAKHPIQSVNKYSKKFQNNFDPELYSPAAVALRDAFDISTAVHRMNEEAALSANIPPPMQDLVEEEESEDEEEQENLVMYEKRQTEKQKYVKQVDNRRIHHQQYKAHISPQQKVFDLNLGGASILERRKLKQVSIPIS